MASYVITGGGHLPDDASPLPGAWYISLASGYALDVGGFRASTQRVTASATDGTASVTLPETVGDDYYLAYFQSADRSVRLPASGFYEFTLTADTTWDTIIDTPTVPPMTPTFTARAEAAATAAEGSEANAETSATEAAASAAEASAITGLTGEDSAVSLLVRDRASATGMAVGAAAGEIGALAPTTQPPLAASRAAITTFQPGHGWTGTGFASVTDDSTDAFFGAQSVKLVTDTAGTSATFDSPVYATIDLTRRELAFPIKLGNLAAVADLRLYAGDTALANAKNISFKPIETSGDEFQFLKDSEWSWFTVSFDTGSDIGVPDKTTVSKFRLRVQAVAGQAVTVHLGGLFTQKQDYAAAFPTGVASFTYDDGRLTGYLRGRAMLEKYGWRGSLYPIWDRLVLGDPYISVQQLLDAQDRGHEVGCHAETRENHDLGFTRLGSTQTVVDELLAERQNFYANGLGDISGFAFPRGMSNAIVEAAARKVVTYGRGIYTASGNTRETLPPANPMRIRAYSVGSTTTLAALEAFIDKTVIAGDWAVLVFHEVRPVLLNDGAPECLQSVHDGIIDYVAGLTNAPAVLPVIDVIRRMPSPELTDIPVGGDLTGTMSAATVTKINGAPVSGTPSTGKVLTGTGSGSSWQPVTGADTWSVNNRIAGGEGVFPRMLATGSQASASGRMLLTYFTAEVTETITQLGLGTASTAAGATPTLARAGIYSIDSSGNGTLIASTANDTALFAASATRYVEPLSSSWAKVAGQRYALGILVVTSAAMPNYPGIAMQGSNAFAVNAPRLAGSIDGQTDLLSTFTDAGISSQKFMPYAELLR